ncbi:gas vesicle protein GvpN [Oceanobacillus piezotolerans]|uniref:Gas vesicle protein GvpN n=1 Tax=Oceanobacillus piezotolerans TaxID=2448030 RepID=A0A498DJT2_9BACI|nr:gas vesicle protein GvpN [Oceanobacillus piezotolerans]RLL42685.1 gas vesicle protein GvpN [Oceanobacillus piezotolerans]
MEETEIKEQEADVFEAAPNFQDLTKRSLRYLETGYPVHFTGPSGIGKTSLAMYIAKARKKPMMFIQGNKDLTIKDLIGSFSGYQRHKLKDNYVRSVQKIEEKVSESWREGRLLEAVRKGYTLVYDEFTRSRPETNNIFLPVLEERILPLYGAKQKKSFIKVHPDFSVIFTSNPKEYAGVYQSQDALLDRMITMTMEAMDKEVEISAVVNKTSIERNKAEVIVDFIEKVRKLASNKQDSGIPSLRASIMIADMVHRYQLPVDGNNDEFFQLCMDITWFPLKESIGEKEQQRVKRQLERECKSITER